MSDKNDKKAASAKNAAVSPEAFVRAWQTSASVAEVATKTGLEAKTVQFRVGRYRKAGIPLKKFATTRAAKIDVASLAKLAQELVQEQKASE